MSLVGKEVDSAAVRKLVVAEQLELAKGKKLEAGLARRNTLSNFKGGYMFQYTGDRLNTLFVFLQPDALNERFEPFSGELVAGLSAGSTRTDVRRALGEPTSSGEATEIVGLRRFGPWDKFDRDSLRLHFEYTEPDERLHRLTVSVSDSAP
jgi:hypothetical protein